MLRFKRYVWNLEPMQSQTWKLLHDSRLNVNGSNQYIFLSHLKGLYIYIWKLQYFTWQHYERALVALQNDVTNMHIIQTS